MFHCTHDHYYLSSSFLSSSSSPFSILTDTTPLPSSAATVATAIKNHAAKIIPIFMPLF